MRHTIGVATASSCFVVLPFSLLATMAVQIRGDLGFDEGALGVLLALFPIGALLTSPVTGRLVQHAGPTAGLRAAMMVTALAAGVIGVAGRAWWVLAVALLVNGLAGSMVDPAANLWITRDVPPSRHSIAIGAKQTAGPLSSVLAGLAVPAIALTFGWRWAFVAVAGVSLLLLPLLPHGGRGGDRPRRAAGGGISRRGPLAITAVGMVLAYAGQSSVQIFYVSSVVEDGISPGLAGTLLALGSISSVITRVMLGVAVDRRPRGSMQIVATMLGLSSIACIVLATGHTALIIAATPIVFASASGWTGMLQLAVLHAYPAAAADATGFVMSGAFLGVVTGPVAFGAIARTTYPGAWTMVCIALAAAATTMWAAGLAMRATGSLRHPVPAR